METTVTLTFTDDDSLSPSVTVMFSDSSVGGIPTVHDGSFSFPSLNGNTVTVNTSSTPTP
jgi:hypothetical protein